MLAAGNNADLYEAVLGGHGITTRRGRGALIVTDTPLPYYSQVVTLDRAAGTADRDMPRPCAVKDSFASLGLAPDGFDILFEARWIWREATGERAMPEGWVRVTEPADLAAWERAWKANGSPTDRAMFLPAHLEDPWLGFFGRRAGDGADFESGCIGNRSAECVGLSNVFGRSPDAFAEAAAVVERFGGGLPVVGYEAGEALDHAMRAGFEDVGPLRVWVSREPDRAVQ